MKNHIYLNFIFDPHVTVIIKVWIINTLEKASKFYFN